MIGETVVVIANPHGLMRTCTTGVVSAIGRTSHLADVPGVTLQGLIQSDAGIDPGSSGGPWFNVAGEVIGVTSSMKRDAQNVAFAISAASLRKAIPAMLNVQRRYGFVTGLDVAAEGPCQVTAVQGDSPAARAKLAVGDVIVKLAGIATASVADYHLALIGRKAGESLLLEWIRGQTVPRSTGARPAAEARGRFAKTAVGAVRCGATMRRSRQWGCGAIAGS